MIFKQEIHMIECHLIYRQALRVWLNLLIAVLQMNHRMIAPHLFLEIHHLVHLDVLISRNTSGNCTISGEYYGSNRDIYSGGSSEICDDFNLQHGEDIDQSIEDNIVNIINKSISTRAHSDINIQSRKNNNPPSSSGVLPETTRNNPETRDTSDVLGSMNIYQDDELITPDSIDPELREYLLSLSSDRLRREAVYLYPENHIESLKENNTMFVYILTDIRYTDSLSIHIRLLITMYLIYNKQLMSLMEK